MPLGVRFDGLYASSQKFLPKLPLRKEDQRQFSGKQDLEADSIL